jgi:DNA-binding NtrC family response regulator
VFKIAKIFIIDDDQDVVLLFEQYLIIEGHDVISKAYDGEEAVQTFKKMEDNPDIILMDHRMPNKNGLEVTKEILNINHNVKVIFLSADYTVKEKALAVGAVDFIEKPIDLDTLLTMIEKHLLVKNEII